MPEKYSFADRIGHTRLRSPKMSDQIADRIRRMVARGELVDGQLLPPEAELMRDFDVSRPTLREAFRLLESDSLITLRRGPSGGARVTIPGPDAAASLFGLLLTISGTTVGDVWDARMIIEPLAVRQLTMRATESDHAVLDREIDLLRSIFGDTHAFGTASVRFRVKLVEMSGNRTLAAVVGMLSEIVERELAKHRDSISLAPEVAEKANKRALRGYEKIVQVVRTGDADLAEKTWREHMRSARHYLHEDDSPRIVDILY